MNRRHPHRAEEARFIDARVARVDVPFPLPPLHRLCTSAPLQSPGPWALPGLSKGAETWWPRPPEPEHIYTSESLQKQIPPSFLQIFVSSLLLALSLWYSVAPAGLYRMQLGLHGRSHRVRRPVVHVFACELTLDLLAKSLCSRLDLTMAQGSGEHYTIRLYERAAATEVPCSHALANPERLDASSTSKGSFSVRGWGSENGLSSALTSVKGEAR